MAWKKSDDTKKKLLTAIAELIADAGLHNVTYPMICKRAEVSNGSLYHAFPDGKIELAREAAVAAIEGRQHAIEVAMDLAAPFNEGAIERVLSGYWKWVRGNVSEARMLVRLDPALHRDRSRDMIQASAAKLARWAAAVEKPHQLRALPDIDLYRLILGVLEQEMTAVLLDQAKLAVVGARLHEFAAMAWDALALRPAAAAKTQARAGKPASTAAQGELL